MSWQPPAPRAGKGLLTCPHCKSKTAKLKASESHDWVCSAECPALKGQEITLSKPTPPPEKKKCMRFLS